MALPFAHSRRHISGISMLATPALATATICLAACANPDVGPVDLTGFADNRCLAEGLFPNTTPSSDLVTLSAGSTTAPPNALRSVHLTDERTLVDGVVTTDLPATLATKAVADEAMNDALQLAGAAPLEQRVLVSALATVSAHRVAALIPSLREHYSAIYIVGRAGSALPDAMPSPGNPATRLAFDAEVRSTPMAQRQAILEARLHSDLSTCPQLLTWVKTATDARTLCSDPVGLSAAQEGCSADVSVIADLFPAAWTPGTHPIVFFHVTDPLPTQGTWAQAALTLE